MTHAKTIQWVDRLIWTLLYGGLFTVVIGLANRNRDEVLSWALMVVGAVVAVAGAVLIWVRSRMREDGVDI